MTDTDRVKYGMVVVVMLSAGSCDIYPGHACVQSVITAADGLPFATREEVDAEATRWPAWCAPHTVFLTPSPHLDGGSR